MIFNKQPPPLHNLPLALKVILLKLSRERSYFHKLLMRTRSPTPGDIRRSLRPRANEAPVSEICVGVAVSAKTGHAERSLHSLALHRISPPPPFTAPNTRDRREKATRLLLSSHFHGQERDRRQRKRHTGGKDKKCENRDMDRSGTM